ncbi:MAG: sigma-70 factor domain-containing protein [Leptolyngbya sp. IPPAS B-1204]
MIITTQRKRAAPKAGKVPFTHKTARRSIPEPEITLDSSKVDLSQQSGLSPVEPTAVIPVLESEPELGIDDGLLDSVDVQFTAANKADSTYLGDAVRQYLVAIGKFPLLTAEQEIVYGRQIEQGQVLLAAQQRAQEKFGLGDTLPTLEQWAEAAEATPEQVQRTMKAYQQAVDKLVVHNLRLVVAVAKNISTSRSG